MNAIIKSLLKSERGGFSEKQEWTDALLKALRRDAWSRIVCEALEKVLEHPSKRISEIKLAQYAIQGDIFSELKQMTKIRSIDPDYDNLAYSWNSYYQRIRPRDTRVRSEDEKQLLNLIGPFVFAIFALRTKDMERCSFTNVKGIFSPYYIPINPDSGKQKAAREIASLSDSFFEYTWRSKNFEEEKDLFVKGIPQEWEKLFVIAENYGDMSQKLFVLKHTKLAFTILNADKSTAILCLALLNARTDIVKEGYPLIQKIDDTVEEKAAVRLLVEENCLETLRCLGSLESGRILVEGKERGIPLEWHQDAGEYVNLRNRLYEQYLEQFSPSVESLIEVIRKYLLCTETEGSSAISFFLNSKDYPDYKANLSFINMRTANTIKEYLDIGNELRRRQGALSAFLNIHLRNTPVEVCSERDVINLVKVRREINIRKMEELLREEEQLQEDRVSFLLELLAEEECQSEDGLLEYQYWALVAELADADRATGGLTEAEGKRLIAKVKVENGWEW